MNNTLFTHYTSEIKYRITYCILSAILTFMTTFYYIEPITYLIIHPIIENLIIYKPSELFISYITVSFYISIIVLIVKIPLQMILFNASILDRSKFMTYWNYWTFWTILVLASVIIHSTVIFPVIFDFFLTLGMNPNRIGLNIELNLSISELIRFYLNSLNSQLILTTTASMFYLIILNSMENLKLYHTYRKITYFIIGIALTTICPPDAAIFIGYYFIIILMIEVLVYAKTYKMLIKRRFN